MTNTIADEFADHIEKWIFAVRVQIHHCPTNKLSNSMIT